MADYALPAVYAVVLWWFATGVILYLDRLPARTFPVSMIVATAVLGAALYGIGSSSNDQSVAGAYLAFTCAVLVWGWLEMSFLMGFIMGPRRHACPDGCAGSRHFGHAVQAILYHEIAIIIAAGAVVALSWNAPNQIGCWTFMVLWGMRISAKLNLFLGVPNLGDQFLPQHLKYLKSFFKRRPLNFLFPLSVTVASVLAVLILKEAGAADATAFEVGGYSLLGAIVCLAVLEHWFLVLPLSTETLWRWSMRADECELTARPTTRLLRP
jgi:putative photosynthetic complex assembly protein 2